MEELLPSVKTHSRKRKNNFPSTNIVTRNKSQINYSKPISFRPGSEPLDTFLEANASRASRIKDLRARRVFTPDVDSILEEKDEKMQEGNFNEGKELLNGSDTGEVLDPFLVPEGEEKEGKDLLEGSGTGPDAGRISSSDPTVEEEDKEVKVNEGKELLKDLDTLFDASRVLDMDVDSVDLKTNKIEKSDEQNGGGNVAISGNGSIPKSKLVGSSRGLRKVFSPPSSFSYRRLLPYLMDVLKDDSSVSKFEIVDARNPSKLQKLGGVLVNAEECSIAENSIASKVDYNVSYSPLEKEETLMSEGKDKKLQMLSGTENELKQKTENIRQLEVEQKNRDNGVTYIDACLLPEGEEKEDGKNKGNGLLEGSIMGLNEGQILSLDSILEKEEKEDKVMVMDVDKSEKSDEQNGSGNGLNLKVGAYSGRRRKVFSSPSSFSYRRLLPYLKDIVNNDPSISKFEIVDAGNPSKLQKLGGVSAEECSISENCITPKLDHSLPLEKDETQIFDKKDKELQNVSGLENEVDQKTENIRQFEVEQKSRNNGVISVDASTEEECVQMTPPDADIFSKTEVGHVGEITKTNNLINPPVLNPCSRLRVFKNTNSHSNRRLLPFLMDMSKNSSFASRITQHPKPLLHSKEDIKENFSEIPQTENCSSPQPSFTNNSSNVEPDLLSSEKPPLLTKQSSFEEQHECLGEVEAHNENDPSDSSLRVEVSDSLVTPENCHSKGILKRNPRGCRGQCNCLNCASFRLHADRAFEFSRNQMYDAEEIASDLMKELATLRLILGKPVNDSSNIQLNKVEARQACDKALEIENVAKARLSQMNSDLNIHCRIPALLQPKVTFANYVQERAYPSLVPTSQVNKLL
ncbi:hypothetical protein ACJIZ3_018083 [Penstemon smallii]|uniref:Uncharacterized protein n=1 Tax=Penstemon smallii TaxID=265156 RepID=A0ABD3SXC0_9LAMI